MVHLKRFFAVSPLINSAAAQSSGDKIWAAVAFVNHGERTPIISDMRTILTPEGAQQMWRQGTAFRARYLRNSVNESDFDDIQTAYIQKLNIDVIDNDDVDILSQTDEWVSAGAMAFMQGLYPPSPSAYDATAGGEDLGLNLDLGDNNTEYPLNGYQYPNIRTASYMDPSSTALDGTARCSAWNTEINTNLTSDEQLNNLYQSTLPFYQNLFSTEPLVGTIDIGYAHFWNAYELWEYVDYMYRHNETVHRGMSNANVTLGFLNSYATTLLRAQNSYKERQGDNDPLGILYSIAGRTLANRVTQLFQNNIKWNGEYNKLSLMFGSLEPIMSFVSLAGLVSGDEIFKEPFSSLPEPGAALVFELFGEDPDFPNRQPSADTLRVRLSYRASADADEDFANQGLFSPSPDGVLYTEFLETMQDLGRTANDWCDICSPTPAPWCLLNAVENLDLSTSTIGPAIGGIIGAIIMLVIVAIVFAGLYFLGGVRLSRNNPPPAEEPQAEAAVGGFKGSDRKGDDPDVVVTKTGVHHERVGSWELRGGNLPPQTSGIVNKDLGPDPRRSLSDDEDGISVMGATPVKEHEAV
ncbi:hypothetical protein NCS57_00025800 [Fusarium keratoplasticum]|uniref:Uncharacterized protein n=1 Tax=Fusarium keratoplasticum TaxID=1328300 RepID=A0ACC0RCD0_9HYPO|nr:hypothetical protein NCS57_00025800 [Fusarium keratoplasticum]KAI8683611.1 hypothetical protein NCS57_00025800 [Fusarium keratoplasticum]